MLFLEETKKASLQVRISIFSVHTHNNEHFNLIVNDLFFFLLFLFRIMNYVTRRFLRCAMVVFSWFVVPYSRVTTLWVPRRRLPPMNNPLLEIRAVKLAHMIRTRQV